MTSRLCDGCEHYQKAQEKNDTAPCTRHDIQVHWQHTCSDFSQMREPTSNMPVQAMNSIVPPERWGFGRKPTIGDLLDHNGYSEEQIEAILNEYNRVSPRIEEFMRRQADAQILRQHAKPAEFRYDSERLRGTRMASARIKSVNHTQRQFGLEVMVNVAHFDGKSGEEQSQMIRMLAEEVARLIRNGIDDC